MSNMDNTNPQNTQGNGNPATDNAEIQAKVQQAINNAYARSNASRENAQTNPTVPKKVYRAAQPAAPTKATSQSAPANQVQQPQVKKVYRAAPTTQTERKDAAQPKSAPIVREQPKQTPTVTAPKTSRPVKKKSKKLVPIVAVITIIALCLAIFVGANIWSKSYFNAGTGISNNKYAVSSSDELIAYLNHPALMEGDTIAVNDDIIIDINDVFNGCLTLPLISFDCSNGSLTFIDGVCYMYGGYNSSVSMNGVAFTGTTLYVDAPNSSITWNMAPSDHSTINVKSLNGNNCNNDLGVLFEGSYTTLPVTITNTSGTGVTNEDVKLTGFNFIFPEGNTINIPELGAGASTVVDVRVLCADGGRGQITATSLDSTGTILLSGCSDYVDIVGGGFYAGDTHTHSSASDIGREDGISTRWCTIEENVKVAYEKGLSFIISVEDNKAAEKIPQASVDSIVGKSNSFVQLAAAETINDYGDISLEFLEYPTNKALPATNYGDTVDDMMWTSQSAINEAVENGATVILPQATSVGDVMESLYRLESMYDVAALEVMQRTVEYPSQRWTVLYRAWDMINCYGRNPVFAVSSSNNISAQDVGIFFTKGYMGNLSDETIVDMIHSGNYFTSNGPEMRFSVGGTPMGSSMDVAEGETVSLNISVSDDVPLTSLVVYKFNVTHKMEDPAPITLLELDLSSENTTSYTTTLTDTVTSDCYYRVEANSAIANNVYAGDGRVYSNPIWVNVESTSGNTTLTSCTYESSLSGILQLFTKSDKSTTIRCADNGDLYIDATDGSFSLQGLDVDTQSPRVSINYHKGAGDKADFVTIRTGAENGAYAVTKLYIVK